MKKVIVILISLCCICTISAQKSSKIQRYGVGAEIAGIAGSGFAYGGTFENKYFISKDSLTKNNIIGINVFIGATLVDGTHFLVGGGYEQNYTYQRGQPYAIIKFNSPVVAISGKMLFSQYEKYKNNYEVAVSLFPGQNLIGIGGFYMTDYDCTVIGAKLTFRFGNTNGGSGKKRDDCSICGL